jgi:hypothetical protein
MLDTLNIVFRSLESHLLKPRGIESEFLDEANLRMEHYMRIFEGCRDSVYEPNENT